MKVLSPLTVLAIVLVPYLQISLGNDSISLSQSITDGMTIASEDRTFELGFFSPGNSKKRYVGIWYKNIPIQTVVWVANRVSPINDSSGKLMMNSTGNLVLTQNGTVVWYTNSKKQAQNPIAHLLDSGNLVVRDENEEEKSEGYLWQSFDYPTDTFLPGMKIGRDLRNGLNKILTSWKSPDDPAPGDASGGINFNNYTEIYTKVGEKYFRGGPWNGLSYSGLPHVRSNLMHGLKLISTNNEVYTTYSVNKSVIVRLVLNKITYRYLWIERERTWRADMAFPMDFCDNYGTCGKYGICVITENPACKCMKGFKPKAPQLWNSMDWSQGCVRNTPLGCANNSIDGFIKFGGLKLPDTTKTLVEEKIGLEECRIKCLNNCSCMAYTNSDIRGMGSGCVMWFHDLIDIREFSGGKQDLYVRVAASELEVESGNNKKLPIIVGSITSAILGMLLIGSYCIYKVRGHMTVDPSLTRARAEAHFLILPVNFKILALDQNNDEGDIDLPLFDLSTIATATDNFSNMNKIGEGGFGPVYKGKLVNGQIIAVKRLSQSSKQGRIEFKNELKLIVRLQHRNLVKLLGCCIQGQENMLVYEYMPNASLDCFIFDNTKGKLLDWSNRFNIICGIARGLLYLHQDSRLRIIHRDLKGSNVLLDDKLNPKISDFGMAKLFGEEQIEGNTNKIVGTIGYMAPEYTTNGRFSTKSDVSSFGILLLEIICGKRNRDLSHPDHANLNLIGYAWMMWKEDRALELVDANIKNSCVVSEVLRCIHVSLLCVQQFPKDRPTMSSVVPMLVDENELVQPNVPAFFPRMHLTEANAPSSEREPSSINEVTISLLESR